MTEPMQPVADDGLIDLNPDQCIRLSAATDAFFQTCETLGLSVRIQLFRLSDTSASDSFPLGNLSEVGRQRTFDYEYSDRHAMYAHLAGRGDW